MSNLFKDIIKSFDADNDNIQWLTSKQGNKYAINEEGKQVAGNPRITQGVNIKEKAENDFEEKEDLNQLVNDLDKLDYNEAIKHANNLISQNSAFKNDIAQITKQALKKQKHSSSIGAGILEGAQAALEALVYKGADIKEALGIALKICEEVYQDKMQDNNFRDKVIKEIKDSLKQKLSDKM